MEEDVVFPRLEDLPPVDEDDDEIVVRWCDYSSFCDHTMYIYTV